VDDGEWPVELLRRSAQHVRTILLKEKLSQSLKQPVKYIFIPATVLKSMVTYMKKTSLLLRS
ncbi:hypothetical protein, partial [Winogradskyella sp.]|uniref:hypothetical protein n=1 Tax=Winogradskyella sp. TaxID=1883156 RepID=UPI003514E83B